MAKIAVLFLLVALVAVSSGYRVAREAPAIPDSLPEGIKLLLAEGNKFFSAGNVKLWEEQLEKIKVQTDSFGDATKAAVETWVSNVSKIVKPQEGQTPK